jgi:hypothetical protein
MAIALLLTATQPRIAPESLAAAFSRPAPRSSSTRTVTPSHIGQTRSSPPATNVPWFRRNSARPPPSRPRAEPRRGVNLPNLPNFPGIRNSGKFACGLLLEAW